jgi:hypothetical protein
MFTNQIDKLSKAARASVGELQAQMDRLIQADKKREPKLTAAETYEGNNWH